MNLCNKGKYSSNGIEYKLICQIDNQNCPNIYWCQDKHCLAMIPNYKQCANFNKGDSNETRI